jgi:hypothetical protein
MLTIVLVVVGAVLGGIGLYLVLRNNPKIKAQIDAQVDKIDKKK